MIKNPGNPPPVSPPKVGTMLKRLRSAQNLTLDDLALRSGVSKSMVSQIERNRTNPTFATIWRLTNALGVGVEQVFRGEDAAQPVIELLPSHATPSITSADGKCRLRILGPLDLAGKVEWYEFDAEPGAALVSDPHGPGTVEHLTVLEGALEVESGGERAEVAAGNTARYRADENHAIRNTGADAAKALLVVVLRAPPGG
ncbi:MAG: helix-turn-helix transcriptional regulator [Proteobacteria bacterium]|nr:helix-turn-helix transcriptional regulator [Pseudomonadota bacterium]